MGGSRTEAAGGYFSRSMSEMWSVSSSRGIHRVDFEGETFLGGGCPFLCESNGENPYIRYDLTEVAQSAIVPTLEKQRYR